MLSNSFPEASLTLISISDKNTIRMENYRPYILRSLDAKIPNKILENPTQKQVKMVIHHNHMWFQVGKSGLTFKNVSV